NRCTTCRKALKWLQENGIAHTVTDIMIDHPDKKTLEECRKLSGLPLKSFFNTSGRSYREMGLSGKLPSMSEEKQLALLASDGMLVKRPLLVGDGLVLIGFKEEEWKDKLLQRGERS
ncbi:MAG: arsenate reductase family protein, partial [Erysipelotrichaceae bacterium]|nr:arsenate reductase family protein [Erysipelotrichaceae bacterium]